MPLIQQIFIVLHLHKANKETKIPTLKELTSGVGVGGTVRGKQIRIVLNIMNK